MKIFFFDEGKMARFEMARVKFNDLEDTYIDAMNFLPDYIGSSFPDALSPNRAQNIMRELEPQVTEAKQQLIRETRRLMLHLHDYLDRLEKGKQCA